MKGLKPEWLAAIVTWAREEPRVAAVFLFGSRARGGYRADSDLDLAVVLTEDENDTASGYAIFAGNRMRVAIAQAIPVSIHLHFAFSEDEVVWPAVQDHGHLLYAG
jgi:predicted nucleotidyltransferase